jgi:hypothetical protein
MFAFLRFRFAGGSSTNTVPNRPTSDTDVDCWAAVAAATLAALDVPDVVDEPAVDGAELLLRRMGNMEYMQDGSASGTHVEVDGTGGLAALGPEAATM